MMKEAKLTGPKRFEIVESEIPKPGVKEVQIKVLYSGVCSSELNPWISASELDKNFGHEVVGVITEVGDDVLELKVGDTVTGMIYRGFAEYTVAEEEALVRVPTEVARFGALAEPFSCLKSALDRTPIEGDKIAVVGTGYMGLGLIKLLKQQGVKEIIAVEPIEERRDLALEYGASEAYHPEEVPAEYKVDDWDDDMWNRGCGVVFEFAGKPDALNLAASMTAVHGHLTIGGFHNSQGGLRTVNMELWNWKAITVLNGHERRVSVHKEAQTEFINDSARDELHSADLVTHQYPLEEINRAFEDQLNRPTGFMKGVIVFEE